MFSHTAILQIRYRTVCKISIPLSTNTDSAYLVAGHSKHLTGAYALCRPYTIDTSLHIMATNDRCARDTCKYEFCNGNNICLIVINN